MRSSNNNNKSQRSNSRSDVTAASSASTSRRRNSNNNNNNNNKKSSSLPRIAPPSPPQLASSCDITLPAKRFMSLGDNDDDDRDDVEAERPPPTAPSHKNNQSNTQQQHHHSYYQLASHSISAATSLMMTGGGSSTTAAVASRQSSNKNHHRDPTTTTTTQDAAYASMAATTTAKFPLASRRSSLPPPILAVVATAIGGTSTAGGTSTNNTPTSTSAVAVQANNNIISKKVVAVETEWAATDLDRRYDLTPVSQQQRDRSRRGLSQQQQQHAAAAAAPPSYFIDPWEVSAVPDADDDDDDDAGSELAVLTVDADPSDHNKNKSSMTTTPAPATPHETDASMTNNNKTPSSSRRSTFLAPGDIHPNMEHKEDEIAHLRLLAGKLNADWRGTEFMAPALARRIRDFQFAQEKRRRKYGDERPWGILGLYDHLSAIRTDVEWAEDQAWRRANGEPYMSWADFDESKRGGYNRPFFTYILLLICTIIMIASIGVNGWKVEPLDVNPMIGPSAETLITMGAKDTTLIVEAKEGWRLLSSAVLHAGLVHFFINMLALWFVGAAIETTHGWFAAMVIFCISAVGGTILSAIFLPEYITVGASGGIFGFIGACCADIVINWRLLFCDFVTENGKKHRHILVVVMLLLDIILNCIIGLTPYVDNFTHLGGMAYGFLCGLSTIERLSSDFFGMEEGWMTQVKHFVVRFFGLIISIVSIVITLVLLLGMDATSNPCPSCTWLSCVPFPPWAGEMDKWWYCDDCGRVTAEIVSQPYRHLELDCPDGSIAEVNFTSISPQNVDRAALQKQLPTYCREYCMVQEERN